MNIEDEYGLFPDLPIHIVPPFQPNTTCAKCEHIVGVMFQRKNLFFCSAQKGGHYGRKIIKSAPNCEKFVLGDGLIPHVDGYYGGRMSDGLSRGADLT
jgi:hypothetical protein